MRAVISALLVCIGNAGVATSATTSYSKVSEFPLGSPERIFTYATNQVTKFNIAVMAEVPMEWPGGLLWEEKRWYQAANGRSYPYNRTNLLNEAVKPCVRSYIGQEDMHTTILTFTDEFVIDPATQWYMASVTCSSPYAGYFMIRKPFRLAPNESGGYRIPTEEILAEPLFVDPYSVPDWEFRVKVPSPLTRVTISTFVPNLNSWATWYEYPEQDWTIGEGVVSIPLRFSTGSPGYVEISYTSDYMVSERFDLATGKKLVGDSMSVSLMRSGAHPRLCVVGHNTSCVLTVERSTDFRSWVPFATITNYMGLAWIDNLPTSSRAFYRTKALRTP